MSLGIGEPGRVSGWVADGFEPVAREFERNFSEHEDLGGAFAVFHDGLPVVDLWGGWRDTLRAHPWESGTLVQVFSGTKGFVSVCLLMLVERGVLDLDAPVARYWPEFGAAGKSAITVGQVVSHRAGVPGIRTRLDVEDVLDARRMADLLASEPPLLEPGRAMAYHRLRGVGCAPNSFAG